MSSALNNNNDKRNQPKETRNHAFSRSLPWELASKDPFVILGKCKEKGKYDDESIRIILWSAHFLKITHKVRYKAFKAISSVTRDDVMSHANLKKKKVKKMKSSNPFRRRVTICRRKHIIRVKNKKLIKSYSKPP